MTDTCALQDMKTALRDRMPAPQINKAILISLKNRFVYARVPKVANSSIKHLIYGMEQAPGAQPIRDDLIHDINYGPVVRPAMLGLASPILHEALFADDFFRFTFVRNPYAKALSNYLDRYMAQHSTVRRQVNRIAVAQGWVSDPEAEVDFSTFLRSIAEMDARKMDIHISPQSTQVLSDLISYHYIGGFETLGEDMAWLANRIWQKPQIDLGFKSPSRTNATLRLKDSYGAQDIALVNRIYAKDFEAFGYRMIEGTGAFSDPDVVLRQATPALQQP